MLTRYVRDESGAAARAAFVYTADEHPIRRQDIDPDAVKIVRRLRRYGHSCYVVGGAVRDLLLGRSPKDFDLVTDAKPEEIRKLFRNSRIIGKRFRLAHIFFRDKTIEVSTFRSLEAGTFHNVFGTIEEDARRRDFSLNALYFDPTEEQIVDFTGGFGDIQKQVLRPVIPLPKIFAEDPVRIIRGVKYAATTGFRIPFRLRGRMRRDSPLLAGESTSRITEEVMKILGSGRSRDIFSALDRVGALKQMLPMVADAYANRELRGAMETSLETLDRSVASQPETQRSRMLAYLCADWFYRRAPEAQMDSIPQGDAFARLKEFLQPITPPNREVELALRHLIRRRKSYKRDGRLPLIGDEPTIDRPRRRRSSGGRGRRPATGVAAGNLPRAGQPGGGHHSGGSDRGE